MITRPSVGSAGLMVVDTAAGPIAVDAVVRLDGCCQIIRSQCLSSNSLLRRLEEMRSLEGRKDLGRGLVSLVGASVASMRVSGDAMLGGRKMDGWESCDNGLFNVLETHPGAGVICSRGSQCLGRVALNEPRPWDGGTVHSSQGQSEDGWLLWRMPSPSLSSDLGRLQVLEHAGVCRSPAARARAVEVEKIRMS
jgi:hypothetical protein